MKSFDAAVLLGIPDMPKYLARVEEKLVAVAATDNPALGKPLTRIVHAPSKRLRSMLVIAAATSNGGKVNDSVIAGCAAIELVHLGSLVHDDIMDSAATRWNIPTVNAREGTNTAIVVGDYLFAKAGVAAATINAEAASLISSTIVHLCDGQSREQADRYNQERTIESYLTAISGKTASLISAACQMGGLCSGLDDHHTQALSHYGQAFGVAFQLIDDLLDFLSTEKLMGKPVGTDVREGIYTLPVLLALQTPHRKTIKPLLKPPNCTGSVLVQPLWESGAFEQTIQKVRAYSHQAQQELKPLNLTPGLAQLPKAYVEWALTHLIAEPYSKEVLQFLR
ncbi:MAG TPA: polyprenyl synthetase family protein [Candidatus Limnocylindria bacterium]|nr:polyprenyl synthetase family protein [Candidatus Limnocylindria bacterium]